MNLKDYLPIAYVIRLINSKKNRNKDFTLLTQNCFAGIIYHCLHLKFQSPIINLRVDTVMDLYKICSNLDYYMNLEITELKNSNTAYPIGLLGDIKLHFNHSKTFEEALVNWNKRKLRINKDNLYIIANDYVNESTRLTKEQLQLFENIPCKKLLIFTQEEHKDLPYTLNIGRKRLGKLMSINKITGLRDFELWFDYVGWLNSDDTVAEHFKFR